MAVRRGERVADGTFVTPQPYPSRPIRRLRREMKQIRSTRIVATLVFTALAAGGVAAAASAPDPTAPTGAAANDCPERSLRLPADAVAPAARAALDSQRGRYEELGTRPLVARAALAEFDGVRGREAQRDCGRRVARRTVVVHLESASARFRDRNPSLSQGIVFVSRFAGEGYRVWQVVR
jgi:hypothetical protein